MGNQRGQATILIGIIFQLVFIFFAMVINVGLLVNDKINLQNSVDIAAYYGAMKQAEVLNSMAQVNYQIRQAWKLLNWRLWVLGDAGRNQQFQQFIAGNLVAGDDPAGWPATVGPSVPAVCVRNALWSDEYKNASGSQLPENFCKKVNYSIPTLKPLQLGPAQSSPLFFFLKVFQNQSQKNALTFNKDCKRGGEANYFFASLIAASYKIAVANRRNAMRNLQSLLISGNDFKDLSGHSVQDTVETVFRKNLTLANKESIQGLEFKNSLNGRPFLVPIDVRLFMKYVDIWEAGACNVQVKDLNEAPFGSPGITGALHQLVMAATSTDYGQNTQSTAAGFASENSQSIFGLLPSLVGFEKNPWVLAYVKVRAQTRPKMLFSPGGSGVVLTAESYAMPFGGRLGPWFRNTWPVGQETSTGQNKIDARLPVRIGEAVPPDLNAPGTEPNYSRFPGDQDGMKSGMARVMGLRMLDLNPDNLPHLVNGEYGDILNDALDGNVHQDPMVKSPRPYVRKAETEAIAPDLFDAAYYSAQDHFQTDLNRYSGSFFSTQICPFGCEDFGMNFPGQVEDQVKTVTGLNKGAPPYWKLKKVEHLNTGWTQEAADRYLPNGGGVSGLVGNTPQLGGRVGYSVKIVSEKFLRGDMELGGKGVTGKIKNLPQ